MPKKISFSAHITNHHSKITIAVPPQQLLTTDLVKILGQKCETKRNALVWGLIAINDI
jgi:hypothetical protein